MKFFLVVLLAVGAFGAQPRGINWRIVVGSDVKEGAYPYQTFFKLYGSHVCGGSIIDSTTILTVAHCVYRFITSGLTIVAGTNQVNSGGDEYEVSDIRTHEDFDHFNADNDIALLKLATPITFTDKIQPVDTQTEYLEGDVNCVITCTCTCTYTRSGEGTCHGDSGGPLVANNKQIGIVSWGRPCAIGYPEVFTRVSAYADWIAENQQ